MKMDMTKSKKTIVLEYSVLLFFGIVLWRCTAFFANALRGTASIGGEIIFLLLPLWWFLGKLLYCR